MQRRKTNRFQEAHRGSISRELYKWITIVIWTSCLPLRLQSAQTLFSGFLTSSRRILACFSVVALSCRDILIEWQGLREECKREILVRVRCKEAGYLLVRGASSALFMSACGGRHVASSPIDLFNTSIVKIPRPQCQLQPELRPAEKQS